MAWKIEFTPKAAKALAKLDKTVAARIARFLRDRAAVDPRGYGKALSGPLGEFWRYRVGEYRILARIEDGELLVLVVLVGHRSRTYR